jgi:type IV pilus assembly protein PilF
MNQNIPILLFISLLVTACASTGPQPSQSSDSEPAQVNLQLGIGYLQNGRYDVAREKLQRALQFDPRLAEAENALGVMYEQLGDSGLSERHYQRALEIKPDYLLAKMNLGRLLCANGQIPRGQQLFLEAAADRRLEETEIAYTGAGVCAQLGGDLAQAERYYRQALEVNSFAPPPLLELARLKHDQGRNGEARDLLQRYHKRASFSPASLQLAIAIETALGNTVMRDEYAQLLRSRFANSNEARQLVNLQ